MTLLIAAIAVPLAGDARITDSVSTMRPDADIAACCESHRRILAALAPLSDDDFRSESLLPRYSRGHLVNHLTNKIRAHVWLFGGPSADEIRRLHPDGYDPDLAADSGADRSADELRAELRHAFDQLEAAWDALDETLWDRQGIMTAGPRTMAEIVTHHLRNVEVHHLDLDTGYRPSDWPLHFVEGELAKRLRGLPDRADHADLLAWLLGRARAPELGPW
jgi:maleylpyruvate isomerase